MTLEVCRLSLHTVQRKIYGMILSGELLPENIIFTDSSKDRESWQREDCWNSERMKIHRDKIIRDVILSGRKMS